jgi:hypothetical protein
MVDNIVGLAGMTGAPLQRWRAGMAASVGAVLLDAGRSSADTDA